MAHGSEEVALQLVEVQQLFVGLFQFLGEEHVLDSDGQLSGETRKRYEVGLLELIGGPTEEIEVAEVLVAHAERRDQEVAETSGLKGLEGAAESTVVVLRAYHDLSRFLDSDGQTGGDEGLERRLVDAVPRHDAHVVCVLREQHNEPGVDPHEAGHPHQRPR